MKKFISLIIAATVMLSVFVFPVTADAADATAKTLMQYKELNLGFKKTEEAKYECKVENNDDGFVNVDANNEGNWYWLMVYSLKPTKSVKPLITVTNTADGSVFKKYEITVTAAKKVKMKDVKFNVGTIRDVKVKNPYIREYKLSYNKKLLKLTYTLGGYGYYTYSFLGLKKGTTTVKAKIGGTVYGSFKVTVGDYKATIKKSFKKSTIKYNKHMKSYYFSDGGSVDLADAIKNYHYDAKYTVKIKNKKIAASRMHSKFPLNRLPKRAEVYSLKPGKTDVTVYEKRGKAKKRKVGTFTVICKTVKDKWVFDANMGFDNDGLFYEYFVSPGDRTSFKDTIIKRYINNSTSGSKFKSSEYKFEFTATPENVVTVDKDGVFTIHDYGDHEVTYKVTFADGSTVTRSGSFDIMPPDFF